MNILYASSEAAPFAKTGGLGDVAGSLPVALKEKGVDARVILPLYKTVPQKYKDQMEYITHIYIDIAWRKQYCGVFKLEYQGCIFYFVDNEYYFGGDQPYDYIHLDCEKFIFFSKAVLSLLPTLEFRPDVINCNDWQTAAIPVFLDTFLDNPFYQGIKTVMTIHNLKYQGRWDFDKIKDFMGISDYYFTSDKLEYYKDANLLKGGLAYANKISTVSESYAYEIQTPEYGEGLEGLISARQNDLYGIVNGISYTEWDPSKDEHIYQNFTKTNFKSKKKINKTELQKELNLPVDENVFMMGVVSRLTDQKGFDLVANVIDRLCEGNIQFVILGTGDEKYENLFRHYAWQYPEKVSANIYFSNEMSHKIYSACDAFLMPSLFEPCGLSQIISMRYGTLPIVRETGGLRDTVIPYNEYTKEGTGFSFTNFNSEDMLHVIYYAMTVYYEDKESWNKLVKTAMTADYSWSVSADKYIGMYADVTGIDASGLLKKQEEKPKRKTVKKATVKKEEAPKKEEKPVAEEKKTVKKATAKKEEAPKKEEKPVAEEKKTVKKETVKKEEAPKKEEKPVAEEKKTVKKATAKKEEAPKKEEKPVVEEKKTVKKDR